MALFLHCYTPWRMSIPAPGCQPLQLVKTELVIKEKKITIVQPEDVDQVLDMYIAQDRLEKDPYWCRVWPSSVALCEEIFDRAELVKGRCVCDLGAGLGLSGLAAAFTGAKRVVLLDQEPLALVCALLSFHINFPGISTNLVSLLELHFPQADAQNLEVVSSPPCCMSQVKGELFDWTKGDPSSVFDTVLACDLLYEKSAAFYLAKLAPGMICSESGRFLLADPVERTPKHRESFLDLLHSTQLNVRERYRKQTEMDGKTHELELIDMKLNIGYGTRQSMLHDDTCKGNEEEVVSAGAWLSGADAEPLNGSGDVEGA